MMSNASHFINDQIYHHIDNRIAHHILINAETESGEATPQPVGRLGKKFEEVQTMEWWF
jgi:hypothetical protein